MDRGIVYILTNPCLDGWVKIGMTKRNDITTRLKELNSPANIPLSYRCYAIYDVNSPQAVEKNIHELIDTFDDSLHARELLDSRRIREREFFKMSPERAYGIIKKIAELRGDVEKLKLHTPTYEQSNEQEIAEIRTKRSNNSFRNLHIPIGTEICFLYNDRIKAKVLDEKNKIEYNEKVYSVTALAKEILIQNYGWTENLHVNGWLYFTLEGKTLSDLRDISDDMLINDNE